MQIDLRLNVMDPDHVDKDHRSGLSQDGDQALIDALVNAGFEIVQGPTAVPGTQDEQ